MDRMILKERQKKTKRRKKKERSKRKRQVEEENKGVGELGTCEKKTNTSQRKR